MSRLRTAISHCHRVLMSRSFCRKVGLSALVAGICVLAGLSPQGYLIAPAYADTKPALPSSFVFPATPIVTPNSGTAVGYLPGSGSAGVDGSYTYKIPLEVPAGRMGMQPNLELVYNSKAGNGILGVGWSLSGQSSISR